MKRQITECDGCGQLLPREHRRTVQTHATRAIRTWDVCSDECERVIRDRQTVVMQ